MPDDEPLIAPSGTSPSARRSMGRRIRSGPRSPRTPGTRPGRRFLIASWIVVGAACAVIVMVAALAVGMRLDDRQINRHLGTATATVLSISVLRTGIEFVDSSGVTIRPPSGVLYPGLLSVGQRFQIEYSTLDPTVVRVAGRSAAVGNLFLGITVAVTVVIAAPLAFWLRRRSRLAVVRSAATAMS